MRKDPKSGKLIFSPSDLVRYLESPFASWMDRHHQENPGLLVPDPQSEDMKLIAESGITHEAVILQQWKTKEPALVEIHDRDLEIANQRTLEAIVQKAPVIYQGALRHGDFAGFTDFLELDSSSGTYLLWDTKVARSIKPYYAVQLCCYAEMLSHTPGTSMPEFFGIILGTLERPQLRISDYYDYYLSIKKGFLKLQASYDGDISKRPEPEPRADHGKWNTHAEEYFTCTDHLVKVAGISANQIKKLQNAGIDTVAKLANASGARVEKLMPAMLEKLVAQARLQKATLEARKNNSDALAVFEIISPTPDKPHGLSLLPEVDPSDVFFDMEGYPLAIGGLEYLWGAGCLGNGSFQFKDWWAHDQEEEKEAFRGFILWAHARWKENPGMHIYHYAPYEVGAVRRLMSRYDTCQDEVSELLRHGVFVDLYQIVKKALRIGDKNYSIKTVEKLYRAGQERSTNVATSIGSVVYYARWMDSGEAKDWTASPILKEIRDYNEDDCKSTWELSEWLRNLAHQHDIAPSPSQSAIEEVDEEEEDKKKEAKAAEKKAKAAELAKEHLEIVGALRARANDPIAIILADLMGFHRREELPVWWRLFDLNEQTEDVLRDAPECIAGLVIDGAPRVEKQSLVQKYTFDPSQECKIREDAFVMFQGHLNAKFTLLSLDLRAGSLELKIGEKKIRHCFGGAFPSRGNIILSEIVPAKPIQDAIKDIARTYLNSGEISYSLKSLLLRIAPHSQMLLPAETPFQAALRVSQNMEGGCLIIQGPPGTGKTSTASKVIAQLLSQGKRVGITSNSHKAVLNLLKGVVKECPASVHGVRTSGNDDELPEISKTTNQRAISEYHGGVIAGTSWLFARSEWEGKLDYLFIDEAGQVSLANAVAITRSTENLVLMGDQMQLEQPIQGTHPGDAGLSVLQYVLVDSLRSLPNAPVFHPVVPSHAGIFLGETYRMHSAVCSFISESIYEGRLLAHPDCDRQKIQVPTQATLVTKEYGIQFSPVEHQGNTQRSEEEVSRVLEIVQELLGRNYTNKAGSTRAIELKDILVMSPYNAQVASLKRSLPEGIRIGSVDRFQGQEAPVCIYSLASSYGEYGSRGLGFILDQNRVNVAISRAQCLAIVVADPRISESTANSLKEMSLLSLFCKASRH
jgi:uncharacterized protein